MLTRDACRNRKRAAAAAATMEEEDLHVSSSRIPMTCLSDEIVLMIFRTLDFISVTRLARTCSRFARIAQDKFLASDAVVVIEGFR